MGWLLALAVSLLLLVAGVKRKLHLGLTMFFSGVSLLVLAGTAPSGLLDVVCATLADRSTQVLLPSIFILEILGKLLEKTGALQDSITALGRLFRDRRLLTAALPACIGILAVPAGRSFPRPWWRRQAARPGFHRNGRRRQTSGFATLYISPIPCFPALSWPLNWQV